MRAPGDRLVLRLAVAERHVAAGVRPDTKIGRSGARPLATTHRSSAAIGVGAVIFELCPSRHSSLPVRGS